MVSLPDLIDRHGDAVDRLLAVAVVTSGPATTATEVFSAAVRALTGPSPQTMPLRVFLLGLVCARPSQADMDPRIPLAQDWFEHLSKADQTTAWHGLVEHEGTAMPSVRALGDDLRHTLTHGGHQPSAAACRNVLAVAVLGPAGTAYLHPPLRIRMRQALRPRRRISPAERVARLVFAVGVVSVGLAVLGAIALVVTS